MFDRPIVFFDLETTGTDTGKDRIVEICVIKHNSDLPFDSNDMVKTMRFNPGQPIPKAASDVHGITDDMVEGCPSFKNIAKSLLAVIDGCIICGFNSNYFDVPILYMEFHRAGIDWDYSKCKFIDAGVIFKRKEERTLTGAYRFFCGKELENAHAAEADVRATKEVFFSQMEKYTDIPRQIDALADYCNYDKKLVDITGKFGIDADGDYIFNFGKNKDLKCKSDLHYLQWMVQNNFPPDATKIARQLLEKYL